MELDASWQPPFGAPGDAPAASGDDGEVDLLDEEAERERDLAVLARVERELAEVEQAMARIEDGTYGICESCQGPIEDEVLRARPTTRLCRSDQPSPDA